MTRQTEDRLRAAYQAKADHVTADRLERLAAQRQQSLLDGTDGWQDRRSSISLFDGAADEPAPLDLGHRPVGTRHARWLAPALAAAAVAAIAVAVTAVATSSDRGKPAPHPPATQVTSPSPSASPSVSTSAPPPPTSSTAVAGPPYLPAGQTGTRSQVPWSAVGPGWRLVLPYIGYGAPSPDSSSPASLYLYDPAGGRYLINDRLPAAASLLAWSPDGTRAMLRSGSSDGFHYQEVSLRSGRLSPGFIVSLSSFVGYTQPKGLAVLLEQAVGDGERLARFSTAGSLERGYAGDVAGRGKLDPGNALYLPDGSEFVSALAQGPLVLMSNDGRLVRSYPLPSGSAYCSPIKWWTGTSVLERCWQRTGLSGIDVLYLQPVSGAAPTRLTTGDGRYQMGYRNAWPLSNGHTLLDNSVGCGTGGYDILLADGTTRPLRGPAGMPATNTPIVNVDSDRVTFLQQDLAGCGGGGKIPHYHLVDYNLVTGATSTLLDSAATMVSWPGRP